MNLHIIVLFFSKQALRWCDEGAYLLASQMVDKFQTKEGAQEALQYLSCHQERAPSAVKNCQDSLSFDFEAVLTPQLEVPDRHCSCHCLNVTVLMNITIYDLFTVPDQHGNREAKLSSVYDQKQRAVFEKTGRCAGSTHTAGGSSA